MKLTIQAAEKEKLFDIVFLIISSALFLFYALGKGSLASWDEAYYAIVTRKIVQTGDWIHLRIPDGTLFFDKPPLYFWLTALSYQIFGINEFATRFPSALCGCATVAVTYLLGYRILGRMAALLGAGILLGSSDFLHYARWGTLDATHLCFFTSTLFGYHLSRDSRTGWLVFWFFSALAALTKGPIIVLAWLIVVIDMLARREWPFRSRPFWAGLLLFLAMLLPWHLAAYLSHPDAFIRDFLLKNYWSRTTRALEGHEGNFYFYIRTLINKNHPWILLAPPALAWSIWIAAFKKTSGSALRFLLVWFTTILGFFTFLVQTKLKWYILPLNPALALLTGAFLAGTLIKPRWSFAVKPVLAISVGLHVFFTSSYWHDDSPGVKALSAEVRALTAESDILYLNEFHEQPAAEFYWERPVRYVDTIPQLQELILDDRKLFFVVPSGISPDAENTLKAQGFKKKAFTEKLKTDLSLYSNA